MYCINSTDLAYNPFKDLESDVIGKLLFTTSQDSEDTKEEQWRKKVGNSDGGFIMHLPPCALRMRCESCLSCAPSLEASVRLSR